MSKFSIEHVKAGMCDAKYISEYLELSSSEFIPALDERVNIKEYSKKLAKNADIFWIKDMKKVCGMCAVYFNDEKEAFITSINIRQKYQGRGCARLLVDNIVNKAKRKYVKKIILEVYNENNRAIRFYKKTGFVEVSVGKKWTTMELQLNNSDKK